MPRDYVPIEKVMAALRRYPDGVVIRELATDLGMRPASLASRLSKAFMYGKGVNLTVRRSGRSGREFFWSAE